MLSKQERQILTSIEVHLTEEDPHLDAQLRDFRGWSVRVHGLRAWPVVLIGVGLLLLSGVIGGMGGALLAGLVVAALGVLGAFVLLYRSCTHPRERGG